MAEVTFEVAAFQAAAIVRRSDVTTAGHSASWAIVQPFSSGVKTAVRMSSSLMRLSVTDHWAQPVACGHARARNPGPDFTLPDHDGGDVSLSDFAGRTVVLYFHPKANTPGS